MQKSVLVAVAAIICSPLMAKTYSPEAEAVYKQRFERTAVDGAGGIDAYSPLEVVPGAKAKPLPKARDSRISAAALAEAEAYAGANNSQAFMVIHKGKVVAEKYFGDLTADSLITSKSLAKPITALAIGRAIVLGKIKSVDQPASDFITEWKGKPQGEILIRHLLDMRTGLLAQGVSMEPMNMWSRAYLHPHHDEIIIDEYPLTDKPGSIYEYSNANAELVAVVIERATGRRYAEFIGTEVLTPIGAPGGQVWVNREGGTAHSGCCALLPAQTFARMAMLVAQDGVWDGKRLLPPGYVAAMKTGTAENPWYGMGLWLGGSYIERRGFANAKRPGPKVLHSEPYLADDVVMFDGNSSQIVYIVPSQQLIVLRVGNNPPRKPEWDNAKLINTVLRGLKTDTPLTPQPR
ncbi:serine hydrolase domain-containing protein [Polymorphobacter sp.]|uniref:serine hydrolase domain-containing protein n=1 Tax=Polymorphobacter sp. TaxID=1909290 RepID=UPI003F703587